LEVPAKPALIVAAVQCAIHIIGAVPRGESLARHLLSVAELTCAMKASVFKVVQALEVPAKPALIVAAFHCAIHIGAVPRGESLARHLLSVAELTYAMEASVVLHVQALNNLAYPTRIAATMQYALVINAVLRVDLLVRAPLIVVARQLCAKIPFAPTLTTNDPVRCCLKRLLNYS